MNSALLLALAGAATLLVGLSVLLVVLLASRRRTARELAASRADVDELRARVDALAQQLESAESSAAAPVVPPREYLITTAGLSADPPGEAAGRVAAPTRAVLSVTIGEPLLKAVAFGYGVRRALSAESRNRIGFEMRREVRRSRKQRRRDAKEALREARRQEAAA